ATAEPSDLWCRRDHRPVYWNQVHRCSSNVCRIGVKLYEKKFSDCSLVHSGNNGIVRRALSSGCYGPIACVISKAGQRATDRKKRQGCRLRNHWAVIYWAGLLPLPAIKRRNGV